MRHTGRAELEQASDVRDAYLRWLTGLATGGFSSPEDFACVGEGASLIGSDPHEWFTGSATHTALEAILHAFRTTGPRLVAGNPQAHSEGAIGWVVDRTVLRFPTGAEVPTRMTAIFRRADGGWQLVHAHHSVGVPNEELAGRQDQPLGGASHGTG